MVNFYVPFLNFPFHLGCINIKNCCEDSGAKIKNYKNIIELIYKKRTIFMRVLFSTIQAQFDLV